MPDDRASRHWEVLVEKTVVLPADASLNVRHVEPVLFDNEQTVDEVVRALGQSLDIAPREQSRLLLHLRVRCPPLGCLRRSHREMLVVASTSGSRCFQMI